MFISLFVPLFVIIIVTIYKLNIFLNFPPLLGAYWTDNTIASLASLSGKSANVLCVAWPGLTGGLGGFSAISRKQRENGRHKYTINTEKSEQIP